MTPKVEEQFLDTMIALVCGVVFWVVITIAVVIGCALWAEPADVNPLTGEVVNEQALPACMAL